MAVRSLVGAHLGGGSNTVNATQVISPINSNSPANAIADEAVDQFKIAVAGDFDRIGQGNGSTAGASRTTAVRVNGSVALSWAVVDGLSGPQVDSTGSAGATSVVAGDLVTLGRYSTGNSSFNGNWANFVSPTTAVTLLASSGYASFSSTGYRLAPISGFGALFTDGDDRAKTLIDVTGTISGCFINVETNTKTADNTWELYVNDAATGVIITVPAGATGRFEPVGTLSASITAGQNAYWRGAMTTSGSLAFGVFGCTLQATAGEKSLIIARAGSGASRTGSATVHYPPILARMLHTGTIEANATIKLGFPARLSNLSVLTATAGYDNVFTVRVNGVDTGLTVTQLTGAAGWAVGGSPVTVTATDDVSLSWTGGTSGTTAGQSIVITVEDLTETPAVGSAAGTSTAAAVGAATASVDGSAAGTSAAVAVGIKIVSAAGSASGIANASAVGAAITPAPTTGSAAGTSTAAAVGDANIPTSTVGNASGASTAAAVTAVIAGVAGSAAGKGIVAAVSDAPPPNDPAARKTIAIEITAAIDATGTLRTFYCADARFVTRPTDTPASTYFEESLKDPGSISVSAFGNGRTGGGTRLSLGEIKLTNTSALYDDWINYGFDGRPVIIRQGTPGAYPADFRPVFVGTVETLTVSRNEVIIRLREKQLVLDRPVLNVRYAGDNALPDGIEGTSADLKDKPKPILFGVGLNMRPENVNTARQAYQIHNGALQDISAVYDRGQPFVKGPDYATSALLLAAVVPEGEFATCLGEGLFRIGNLPAGEITADAVQGSNAGERTAAQALKALALMAGLTVDEINLDDVAALDSENPSVIGKWITDAGETYAKAMDDIAESVGAYYAFDPTGVLRMARLTEPAGVAVLEIEEYDIKDPFERRPAKDGDLPTWSWTIRHSRFHTVQTTDLATGVANDRRAALAQEYRSTRAEDASVKTQFLLATESSLDTVLTSAAEAATEAERRLELHKVRRNFFEMTVQGDLVSQSGAWLMDVVQVRAPRFGLSSGVKFRILGIQPELAKNEVTLTLWG